MINQHTAMGSLIAMSLAVGGCQAATGPGAGIEIVPARAAGAATVFGDLPSISQITPADGLGRLGFKLTIRPAAAPSRFGLLALPDGSGGAAANMTAAQFTQATVTLHSPTVSGTYDPARHAITLNKAAFTTVADGGGYYTATGTFGALRPATDYAARIFLRNNAGAIATDRLGGSAASAGVTIQAGANNVDFTCTVNGQEASYNLSTSTAGNNVSDGGLVRGDTVTFNTGMANNQPGVSRLDVELSGAAYTGGGPTIIRRITNPASFASFTWDTSADSGGAGETYVAADLLAPATGVTGNAGRIDVVAYNADNSEVGRAAFAVTVFGTPTTIIRVQ